ncbi:MAG: AAA domain-containing protein [Paludibacteraceae bacterium]|nr:AAA domain-containing protein [Paludibacteraceae bacterium]
MDRHQSIDAHFQRQQELLKMEYDHEKQAFEQRSKLTEIAWKVKHGVCWFPLTVGRSYYNAVNQFCVDVYRNGGASGNAEQTGENSEFEYGKPVAFFTQSGLGEAKPTGVTGTVSYVEDNRMVVVLSREGDVNLLKTNDMLGVQLYFDETTYQLMFSALRSVQMAKGDRTAYLRDLLLSRQTAEFRPLAPMSFPWLNESQESAVNKVLCAREVAIVHGPPGTGKTTTLVEAICETLNRENQILVCAQSNMAVDWISEQLSDRGVSVLRIGNPTRVTDKMLGYTYERRFESHPLYHDLWSVRQAIRNLQQSKNNGNRREARAKIANLRDRGTNLELAIRHDLFDQCRIVACTLTGAAHRLLEGIRFQSLFIDEAAQALEASCWIAIQKADRVIFAGDHCQLPPTIKCVEAANKGLAETLMEQVSANKPECVSFLNLQYRMHETIVKFPSEWFYGGELKTSPTVLHRNILEFDAPLVWLDTQGLGFEEEITNDQSGRYNEGEAVFIVEQLEKYIEKIGTQRVRNERIDFGLISPYKSQVQRLRKKVKSSTALKPVRSAITVNTIDGFQGQERDVILISLVRANDDGNIGFLRELRRMNVAITRARMKLIIVGDSETLTRHAFYRKLYSHVQNEGKVISFQPEAGSDEHSENK